MQVARFIELTAGVAPSQTLVDAVYRGTEGNPFFVNEVVKLLVEEGRLKQQSGESVVRIPLPQGVREVVGRRLDHLSEACNRVLTVASVIGREFNIHTLEPLCDISSDELIELLDEAIGARVKRNGNARSVQLCACSDSGDTLRRAECSSSHQASPAYRRGPGNSI